MPKYTPEKIERKWQKYWETKKLYFSKDTEKDKPNYMLLTEFPYPSGNLHIGHWYAFAIPDIYARYLRMKGKNVSYPMGFDAFGLPAENAAIKNNINPRDWTEQNIAFMTKQLKSMGAVFDWPRKVRTIDPEYYKWTQWLFLKFYEKGLAYRAKTKANWCPKDKTVLANEQVIDGRCDRCGTEVIQKEIEQWMFKITEYADKLTDDLDKLDWPETTKLAQKNWIGRSMGAQIEFKIKDTEQTIKVFTTRPDTIASVTFLVVSPEHFQKWIDFESGNKPSQEVRDYIVSSFKKTDLERQSKEKSGVATQAIAINPITGEEIPVWLGDYVLPHVGTGAIMGVPAYDERDKEFAEKFGLPIIGKPLSDLKEIIKKLEEKKVGKTHTTYRLRDWLLSRQRYWGVPIPMIHCQHCGYQPVPEKDLPVKLPKLDDFKPSDNGKSPLAKATSWIKTKCPKCGENAERETDTMDTFVDSSWYFLRYTDPKNKKTFADDAKMGEWLPIPLYIGGAEHNTMHLLYSRFFTKALHDLGYLNFSEPFLSRRNHGTILGPDNQKMSKSRGNVVNPDIEVTKYGADTVRMYLAFMGPYEQGGPWDPQGINGVYRFLNRIWNFVGQFDESTKTDTEEAKLILNKTTKEVGEDIKNLKFNTCVSTLMKLLNAVENKPLSKNQYEVFLKLLAPFAPHLTEELWTSVLGNKNSIHLESWPEFNEEIIAEEKINLVIQINGKMRDVITVKRGLPKEEVKQLALASEKIKKYLSDNPPKDFIYVQDKLINFVG